MSKKYNFIEACNSGKDFRINNSHLWLRIIKKQVRLIDPSLSLPQVLPVDMYLINATYELKEDENK